MAKPAVRASSPRAAMKALKPPPLPPKKPLPVLGATGVEPGPGVFSPRTLVVFEGVAVGVFSGFSTGGVGVVIVSGGLQVLVTVQLGGGGVQPSGLVQPVLTVLTLRKLAVPVPPAGTTIPVCVAEPTTV